MAALPLSYWCILIAGLLPMLTVAFAKYPSKDFDNSEPRAWLDKQTGFRRRADYAHRNHFEAFPFFAAAVLVAQQSGVTQSWINGLAMAFIATRLIYTALYLADVQNLRSPVWIVGYACVVGLFVVSGLHL